MGVRAAVLVALLGVTLLAGPVSGAMIYMTAATDATEGGTVTAIKTMLEAMGHGVTVGVKPSLLTDAVDLSPYQAVILNAGATASVPNIPDTGETSLVNFVNAGGGLVTSELLCWTTGTNTTLATILPATRAATGALTSSQTYLPVGPADPIIYGSLPGNVAFNVTLKSGVGGTKLAAKAGATTFYNIDVGGTPYGSLIGWDAGDGKVITFGCLIGGGNLASEDFKTLFSNSVAWVLPEPGTLSLLALAGAGLLFGRKRK